MSIFKRLGLVESHVRHVDGDRRSLLKGMGLAGGLMLAAPVATRAAVAMDHHAADAKLAPSVYLTITPDSMVHIFIHRVEMGQGSRTGLPMIIADELDADWDRINFIQGLGDKKYGDQNTDGSTSIRKFYEPFRIAGASARAMLEQAAATAWGVPLKQVTLKNHQLHNLATGATAEMGEFVAAAQKLPVPDPASLKFKTKAERKYVGKPVPILDLDDITVGKATFGQDVRIDGMLYAVAARPPVVGGKLTAYDKAAAMAVSGVVDVVELPEGTVPVGFNPLGGVAVLANNTWAAMKGRDALMAEFDHGANAAYDSEAYASALWAGMEKEGRIALDKGNAAEGLKGAARTYKADYYVPHLSHAPMEPPAATAAFAEDGSLDIYSHGQDPQVVQGTVAAAVGLDAAQVRVHSKLLGGAFGRKSKPDFAAEAAILAKAAGKPVKMVWTREDDIKHGFYHSVSAQRVEVGIDADGTINSWHHKAAYPSIMSTFAPDPKGPVDFELGLGLLDMPFSCNNIRIEACEAPAHVRIGWLRSVDNIQQAFAVGSMVGEIAAGEGRDDLDVWMALLGDDRKVDPKADGADYSNYGETLDKFAIDTARHKAVLKKVADMAGWGRDAGQGKALGIAVHRSFVSYVACAVEVEALGDGSIRVPRAWMAVDCGLAVNPDRVKAQMEGAVNFGLSIAFHGEISVEGGAVVQGNYDDYPVVRIDEAPFVDVHIMDVDAPPGGVGEPGVPPVAPALANAIFRATGKRVRRLPLARDLSA